MATTVGLSFTGMLAGANDTPIDNGGSDGLENDYFLIGGAGGTSTSAGYIINGLPALQSVSFFLYAPNFGGSHAGGTRGYTLSANGTFVTVSATSNSDNTALLTVMTDANGEIFGTWSSNIPGYETDWSGLQLAYNLPSSVPESGSALLLLSVGLVAVESLRRKCVASVS